MDAVRTPQELDGAGLAPRKKARVLYYHSWRGVVGRLEATAVLLVDALRSETLQFVSTSGTSNIV